MNRIINEWWLTRSTGSQHPSMSQKVIVESVAAVSGVITFGRIWTDKNRVAERCKIIVEIRNAIAIGVEYVGVKRAFDEWANQQIPSRSVDRYGFVVELQLKRRTCVIPTIRRKDSVMMVAEIQNSQTNLA